MQELVSAFPLLKKKRFYLIFAAVLLLAVLTGFLYLPETDGAALSFEEEKGALEEALALTRERLLTCPEDERSALLEEQAFYESALKFRLSPWSSYFSSEALSLYAHLFISGGEQQSLRELEAILKNRDKNAFAEFCKKDPSLPDPDSRLLSAKDTPQSPGKNALLYDLSLLEESLEANADHYFGTKKPLSASDRALFQKLLTAKEDALLRGDFNPVPANRETLRSSEEFCACLFTVLLLTLAGCGAEQKGKTYALPSLLIFSFVFSLACALALFLTTWIFAPGTIEAAFLQNGCAFPFFPALVLRLFCQILGSFPLAIMCAAFRKKGSWKFFALLPPLRDLAQSAAVLLPKSAAGFLSLGSLRECIFPDRSAYALQPVSPAAGITLWLLALILSFVFLLKKAQKITHEKQELSLENSFEL